jgi:hypothetical protein
VVVVEPLNPFSQGLEHVNRRIGATVAELNDLNGVKRLNPSIKLRRLERLERASVFIPSCSGDFMLE